MSEQLYTFNLWDGKHVVELYHLTRSEADVLVAQSEGALIEAGYERNIWGGLEKGEDSVDIFVDKDFDDNDPDFFPGGELGRALASERAEEYAKIAQQNAEDAAYFAKPVVTYQGVVGRWNPDDGYIFEP